MAEACGSRPPRSRPTRSRTACRWRSRRRCATAHARAPLLAVPLDVLVVAAYGLILPPEVLAWPRAGCLNIHASKLPRWRGAAPIARAIEAGDAADRHHDHADGRGPRHRADDRRASTSRSRPATPPATLEARLAGGRGAPRSSRRSRGWPAGGDVAVDAPAGRRRDLRGEDRAARKPRSTGGSRPTRIDRRIRALDPAPGAFARLGGHRRQAGRADGRATTDRPAAPGTLLPARGVDARRVPAPTAQGRLAIARLQAGRQPLDGRRGVPRGPVARRGARFALPGRRLTRCSTSRRRPRARWPACSTAARCRPRSPSVDDGSALRGRTLVQELAYGTLRHWGTLAAIVARLATRPPGDAEVRALLAVALYQLRHTRAPAFAIVDRAVDAAGVLGHPRAGGLVNALLRRELRERATIDAALVDDPVARWSHPRWWIERVRRDWPDDWQQVLAAGNERPPLTLRVNVRATTRDALLAHAAHGAASTRRRRAASGIIVDPPRPVTELPGYAEGAVRGAGPRRAARSTAARPRRRPARARRVRGTRAARPRTSSNRPTST